MELVNTAGISITQSVPLQWFREIIFVFAADWCANLTLGLTPAMCSCLFV